MMPIASIWTFLIVVACIAVAVHLAIFCYVRIAAAQAAGERKCRYLGHELPSDACRCQRCGRVQHDWVKGKLLDTRTHTYDPSSGRGSAGEQGVYEVEVTTRTYAGTCRRCGEESEVTQETRSKPYRVS